MSSFVSAVFKATIGLLVNIGRDKAAEKLRDGDVTDQRIRELIVREIDDIKSKLDGLARKDLLTSISYFRRGVGNLFELLDKTETSNLGSTKNLDVGLRSNATTAAGKTVSLAKRGFKKLTLTDLDDDDKRLLANSKEEFKTACLKATEAFHNEALSTSDRIQAMIIRVAATILEKVDYPQNALTACRLCLEELHSMPAVQGSFAVEFKKGFWSWFSKAERREIIVTVYRLNRVVYDVTEMVCGCVDRDIIISNWHCVDFRGDKVYVLSDFRVKESLRKLGLGHYCEPMTWTFGLGRLEAPVGVVSNCEGEFIVADRREGISVFDNTGRDMYSIATPSCNGRDMYSIATLDNTGRDMYSIHATPKFDMIVHDVSTDKSDSIYVLMKFLPHYPVSDLFELDEDEFKFSWVYCYEKHSRTHSSYFPLKTLSMREQAQYHSLTVGDNNNVLVLGSGVKQSPSEVAVFEPNGQFVRTFGGSILTNAWDISATNDNLVMVLDGGGTCVQVFSEDGEDLFHFQLEKSIRCSRIAFSRLMNCVLVAVNGKVLIYTNKGQYVCDFEVYANKIQGITVFDSRIGLACDDRNGKSQVLVLDHFCRVECNANNR